MQEKKYFVTILGTVAHYKQNLHNIRGSMKLIDKYYQKEKLEIDLVQHLIDLVDANKYKVQEITFKKIVGCYFSEDSSKDLKK